jgi:hypothetical protein
LPFAAEGADGEANLEASRFEAMECRGELGIERPYSVL